MGLLNLFSNTIEGTLQAGIGTAKQLTTSKCSIREANYISDLKIVVTTLICSHKGEIHFNNNFFSCKISQVLLNLLQKILI